MSELFTIRNFSIIFIYTILFGTAAFDKLKSLRTPEWFINQFSNTFIAKIPAGAKVAYWLIALYELVLTLSFIASILNMSLLPIALTGALFIFGILLFGLRLTSDFQGSANMFIYFAATLISLFFVTPH